MSIVRETTDITAVAEKAAIVWSRIETEEAAAAEAGDRNLPPATGQIDSSPSCRRLHFPAVQEPGLLPEVFARYMLPAPQAQVPFFVRQFQENAPHVGRGGLLPALVSPRRWLGHIVAPLPPIATMTPAPHGLAFLGASLPVCAILPGEPQ